MTGFALWLGGLALAALLCCGVLVLWLVMITRQRDALDHQLMLAKARKRESWDRQFSGRN